MAKAEVVSSSVGSPMRAPLVAKAKSILAGLPGYTGLQLRDQNEAARADAWLSVAASFSSSC